MANDIVQDHIDNRKNPHGINKQKLGLGKLENFPIATDEEALAGEVKDRYLTPAKLKKVFQGELMRRGYMNENGNVILP